MVCLLVLAPSIRAQDVRAIVERSIGVQNQNAKLIQSYTYRAREVTRDLDSKGKVKETRTELYEVLPLGGKEYRHLLEKNGKPLPPNEAKREQEKLDKAVAEANRLTPAERAKREAARDKEKAKEQERLKSIPLAFDFQLLGQPTLNSRPAYEILATPKSGYRGPYDNLLRNVRGKFWIDQQDYHWARVEAEALDTISVGWVLARLAKGTTIMFEETRVNNEIWLPKRVEAKAAARLALLKKFNVEQEVSFSDYRKYQTETRITGVTEAPGKGDQP